MIANLLGWLIFVAVIVFGWLTWRACRILQARPHIGSLVITMFDDNSSFAAMRAGAHGYLLNGAEPEETLRAIRALASGGPNFSPTVARQVIDFFSRCRPNTPALIFAELTERERDVLALIGRRTRAWNKAEARLSSSVDQLDNYRVVILPS